MKYVLYYDAISVIKTYRIYFLFQLPHKNWFNQIIELNYISYRKDDASDT